MRPDRSSLKFRMWEMISVSNKVERGEAASPHILNGFSPLYIMLLSTHSSNDRGERTKFLGLNMSEELYLRIEEIVD